MEVATGLSPDTCGALVLINLVGMFVCAITGFGENIIFQLGWYLMSLVGWSSGDLDESVIILTIIMFPLVATQAAVTWRHVNLPMAAVMAVASSASSALGVELLVEYDNIWLKRLLGVLLLSVFLWRFALEGRLQAVLEPPCEFKLSTCRSFAMVLLAGLASGFLGGLFGTPGPPNMVFVLLANVGKDEWRSTQAVVGLVQLPVRLLALYTSKRHPQSFGRLWSECLVSFGSGMVGLAIGNLVAPRVSNKLFRQMILTFLLYGGLTLCTAQMGELTPLILVVTCAVSLAQFGCVDRRTRASDYQALRENEDAKVPGGAVGIGASAP